jgi:hypothetical protein
MAAPANTEYSSPLRIGDGALERVWKSVYALGNMFSNNGEEKKR